jgi:alpha-galactosidase
VLFEEMENPFLTELVNIYGHITYPGANHPGEYIPWSLYYTMAGKYDFKADAGHSRQLKQQMQDTVDGKVSNHWWVKQSGERAIPIMIGIEHDTKQHEHAVNIQNDKPYIDRLPVDCTVEIPATVDKNGIHGTTVGRMPRGIEALLVREAALQDLVTEAAVTGDYNCALQALCIDGTVPNPNIARAILDKMLAIQKQYLPQFNQRR